MWAYGGTTAVDDPAHAGDLDTYVVISRRPGEATAGAIEAAQDRSRAASASNLMRGTCSLMTRAAQIRGITHGATSGATPRGP